MITNIPDLPYACCGIYKIEYDNGKIYIGQAKNIRARAYGHNYKNKQVCDKALKKHSAKIYILKKNVPIKDLNTIEDYYIEQYDATNKNIGYNILKNGNVSNKKGVNSINSAFTEETLPIVLDLIINHSEISLTDIAKKFNVSNACIYSINAGKTYFQEDLIYPLRKDKGRPSACKNNIQDYFQNENELISLKDDLKYRWDLTIEEDLKQKYNIPLRVLRDINNGRKFQEIGNYEYPIRNKNSYTRLNLTQQDIIDILNLLKNSKLSMKQIGNQYNIHRSTIAKINIGDMYIIKDYKYPARKINN